MSELARSSALFVLAGLCEIGGGYLVWQWWRNGRAWWAGALGAATLVLYGVVPTYQPAHFGRVYAAYGGWFAVLRSRGDGRWTAHRPIATTSCAASSASPG